MVGRGGVLGGGGRFGRGGVEGVGLEDIYVVGKGARGGASLEATKCGQDCFFRKEREMGGAVEELVHWVVGRQQV